jgi:hypothetical protein
VHSRGKSRQRGGGGHGESRPGPASPPADARLGATGACPRQVVVAWFSCAHGDKVRVRPGMKQPKELGWSLDRLWILQGREN